MNKIENEWNEIIKNSYKGNIECDNWLDQFANIINSCDESVIDLGCGQGNISKILYNIYNKNVIACDFSQEALNIVNKHLPNVVTVKFDMKDVFPFKSNYTSLVIADLSLHYFDDFTTKKLLMN